jgi:hypothetical protein
MGVSVCGGAARQWHAAENNASNYCHEHCSHNCFPEYDKRYISLFHFIDRRGRAELKSTIIRSAIFYSLQYLQQLLNSRSCCSTHLPRITFAKCPAATFHNE